MAPRTEDNRRNVYFSDPVTVPNNGINRDTTSESSDEDPGVQAAIADQAVTQQQRQLNDSRPPRRTSSQAPPSPATGRKVQRFGHKLTLKKGRRTRQRCESERSLAVEVFGSADIPEEALEGWDIANPGRSHFTTLLTESENAELLKDFVDGGCDANPEDGWQAGCGKPPLGCSPETPEEAFLSISTALRGALKKHYHEGALEALEEKVMSFFVENPSEDYVADHLDAYERLLVHAASKYHQLHSRSFDEDGKRKIKIGNPLGTEFNPMDPSLSKYLKIRAVKNKQRGL